MLDERYWADRYRDGTTGWDLGAPSTPLKTYIDQLTRRDLRILIPGAGRAYEAEYLHRAGHVNVFVIDLTDEPYRDLLARCPDFPKDHLLVGDLFAHEDRYDRILEQTFFCALDPVLRPAYVRKMHELLVPGGRLVGVLFDHPLNTDKPPFGGDRAEYEALFGPHFPDLVLERCHNSIPPRAGRELWLRATRAALPYGPIACSLHDQYEAWATLRTVLHIEHAGVDGAPLIAQGRITDLQTRPSGDEWMTLDNGETIRLDRIRAARPRND